MSNNIKESKVTSISSEEYKHPHITALKETIKNFAGLTPDKNEVDQGTKDRTNHGHDGASNSDRRPSGKEHLPGSSNIANQPDSYTSGNDGVIDSTQPSRNNYDDTRHVRGNTLLDENKINNSGFSRTPVTSSYRDGYSDNNMTQNVPAGTAPAGARDLNASGQDRSPRGAIDLERSEVNDIYTSTPDSVNYDSHPQNIANTPGTTNISTPENIPARNIPQYPSDVNGSYDQYNNNVGKNEPAHLGHNTKNIGQGIAGATAAGSALNMDTPSRNGQGQTDFQDDTNNRYDQADYRHEATLRSTSIPSNDPSVGHHQIDPAGNYPPTKNMPSTVPAVEETRNITQEAAPHRGPMERTLSSSSNGSVHSDSSTLSQRLQRNLHQHLGDSAAPTATGTTTKKNNQDFGGSSDELNRNSNSDRYNNNTASSNDQFQQNPIDQSKKSDQNDGHHDRELAGVAATGIILGEGAHGLRDHHNSEHHPENSANLPEQSGFDTKPSGQYGGPNDSLGGDSNTWRFNNNDSVISPLHGDDHRNHELEHNLFTEEPSSVYDDSEIGNNNTNLNDQLQQNPIKTSNTPDQRDGHRGRELAGDTVAGGIIGKETHDLKDNHSSDHYPVNLPNFQQQSSFETTPSGLNSAPNDSLSTDNNIPRSNNGGSVKSPLNADDSLNREYENSSFRAEPSSEYDGGNDGIYTGYSTNPNNQFQQNHIDQSKKSDQHDGHHERELAGVAATGIILGEGAHGLRDHHNSEHHRENLANLPEQSGFDTKPSGQYGGPNDSLGGDSSTSRFNNNDSVISPLHGDNLNREFEHNSFRTEPNSGYYKGGNDSYPGSNENSNINDKHIGSTLGNSFSSGNHYGIRQNIMPGHENTRELSNKDVIPAFENLGSNNEGSLRQRNVGYSYHNADNARTSDPTNQLTSDLNDQPDKFTDTANARTPLNYSSNNTERRSAAEVEAEVDARQPTFFPSDDFINRSHHHHHDSALQGNKHHQKPEHDTQQMPGSFPDAEDGLYAKRGNQDLPLGKLSRDHQLNHGIDNAGIREDFSITSGGVPEPRNSSQSGGRGL